MLVCWCAQLWAPVCNNNNMFTVMRSMRAFIICADIVHCLGIDNVENVMAKIATKCRDTVSDVKLQLELYESEKALA